MQQAWAERDWLRLFEMGVMIFFVGAALAWVILAASVPAASPPLIDENIQVYAHAMPNQGWAPLTVYFSAYGTNDPNGQIMRYQWDLDGNGSFESDATAEGGYASYVYSKPRDYTISVKVTNDKGATATASTTVHVRHPAASSVDYRTVFDDSRVRRVDIQLTKADWDSMWVDPPSKTQVMADAIVFGERLEDIGFSMRGQFSLIQSGQKKPWKIDTDAYIEGQEFHNLKQLIFTNNIGDPSMLQEKMTYDMMHFVGVPAGYVCFVEFWIDLVDDDQPPIFWGVYTMIERVDKKFLANRFGKESKDGNLYKASHAQSGPMDLVYHGDSIEDYPNQNGLYAYGKASNEEIGDYSDILNLIYIIDGVRYETPDEFAQALEQVFNVDIFLRYMSVINTIGNWDSYVYTGNNYYLFNNSNSGKFEWIPWDLTWGESTEFPLFGTEGPGLVESAPLYTHVFEVDRYRLQYAAYVDLLARHWFNKEHVSDVAENYHTMIAPYVTQSTGDKMYYEENRWFPIEAFTNSWVELANFAQVRNQYIVNNLSSQRELSQFDEK